MYGESFVRSNIGMRFSLRRIEYVTAPTAVARVNPTKSQSAFPRTGPVSVLIYGLEDIICPGEVEKEKLRMLSIDDVISEDFLRSIILCRRQSPQASHSTKSGNELPRGFDQDTVTEHLTLASSQYRLQENHDDHQLTVCHDWQSFDSGMELRPGPYYLEGTSLYQVYRLYDDPNAAFMFGVTEVTRIPPSFEEQPHGLIQVPSRLYSISPTASKPLSGKRVAIKDVFHLRGTRTSASSRDFQSFHGKAQNTAEMVARLIEAGAVIVGKTKTAQFASGENAPDWVDYQCPFNPRGDGYMDPNGSSTGSAAGLAAYPWLDYSLGTDTLGSMLGPAAVQGIFGLRPSHGLSNLAGVIPVSKYLDTAGFFTRSLHEAKVFARTYYALSGTTQKVPRTLLYAVKEFGGYPQDVQEKMDIFVQDLERMMEIDRTSFDVSASWKNYSKGSPHVEIAQYLHNALAHIQLFDCYRNNLPFRQEFRESRGREPYANPMIRFKWGLGSELTAEQYETALERQRVYRKFLHEHVFVQSSILVLPAGQPHPRYRDVYDAPPHQSGFALQGFGFLRDLYSFLGGLPQLVLPIASVTRQSPVTNTSVEVPVCVSIVGAPGTDEMLLELAENVFRFSARPLEVLTGSRLFP